MPAIDNSRGGQTRARKAKRKRVPPAGLSMRATRSTTWPRPRRHDASPRSRDVAGRHGLLDGDRRPSGSRLPRRVQKGNPPAFIARVCTPAKQAGDFGIVVVDTLLTLAKELRGIRDRWRSKKRDRRDQVANHLDVISRCLARALVARAARREAHNLVRFQDVVHEARQCLDVAPEFRAGVRR
jgi:hypothetical protein